MALHALSYIDKNSLFGSDSFWKFSHQNICEQFWWVSRLHNSKTFCDTMFTSEMAQSFSYCWTLWEIFIARSLKSHHLCEHQLLQNPPSTHFLSGPKAAGREKVLCVSLNSPHSERPPGQTASLNYLPFWILGNHCRANIHSDFHASGTIWMVPKV